MLDLFAGTGALGLEALSRGAARCMFVEADTAVAAVLRGNIAGPRVRGPEPRSWPSRYERALAMMAARGICYDLLFVDPPYRMLAEVSGRLGPCPLALLRAGGLAVIEGPGRWQPEVGVQVRVPTTVRRHADHHGRQRGGRPREDGSVPGHVRPGHRRSSGHHHPVRGRFRTRLRGRGQDALRKQTLFTLEERMYFLEESTRHLPNVSVIAAGGSCGGVQLSGCRRRCTGQGTAGHHGLRVRVPDGATQQEALPGPGDRVSDGLAFGTVSSVRAG